MKPNYSTTRLANYVSSVMQAVSVNVPPVLFIIFQEEFGVTYGQLGFLVMLTFFIQIGVDFLLARISHKLNLRALMVGCGAFTLVGYILLAAAPHLFPVHTFYGLIFACFFYSAGSGILEVMSSPVNDAIPSSDKGASMGLLHSFYCWGQLAAVLLTTLLLRIVGRENWTWIIIFWMAVPIFDMILYIICPLPPMISGNENGGVKLSRMSLFWVALLVMICSGASEQAMAQWASMFAQKGLGVSKTLGDIAGPCFFALLMGSGRLIYGIKGDKLRIGRVLVLLGGLCIFSYLLTIFSPSPVLSLIGVGVCGFSVSMMWPGTLVLASKSMPEGGTKLFAMLAMGGDIGCSLGPWISGIVSDTATHQFPAGHFGLAVDQFALRCGMFTAIIFPLLLMFFVPRLKKKEE